MTQPKCVVLFSGGIDSSTLLFDLRDKGYDCYPLTITYGQRHRREIYAAIDVCEVIGGSILSNWKYLELDALREFLPSSLTGKGDIPVGHYQDITMRSTVVPNRNMILLAIAGGYAQGINAKYVAYAPHMGDHPVYPDCRPAFIAAVEQAIKIGTGWEDEGVELLTPYAALTKADIIVKGQRLNVPYSRTWSCYKGDDIHCGVCGTCNERKEAFRLAGVIDPTQYLK
jgi:7-cyano-7-deazaguanine synthase